MSRSNKDDKNSDDIFWDVQTENNDSNEQQETNKQDNEINESENNNQHINNESKQIDKINKYKQKNNNNKSNPNNGKNMNNSNQKNNNNLSSPNKSNTSIQFSDNEQYTSFEEDNIDADYIDHNNIEIYTSCDDDQVEDIQNNDIKIHIESKLETMKNINENNLIDFILVYAKPYNKKEEIEQDLKHATFKREVFEKNLKKQGLLLNKYQNGHLYFITIYAPRNVLLTYADIMKLRMPMKCYDDIDSAGKKSFNILSEAANFIVKAIKLCIAIEPANMPMKKLPLTCQYTKAKHYLFDEDNIEFLNAPSRSLIVDFIVSRQSFMINDKDLSHVGIQRLIEDGIYKAAYPLHDGDWKDETEGSEIWNTRNETQGNETQENVKKNESLRYNLYKEWASLRNWIKNQPADQIKEYLGVKCAFYFIWLGFYTHMLIPASFIGVLVFLYGVFTLDQDQLSTDICNADLNIIMCPLCDRTCDYWKLSDTCNSARITYLFDNNLTILFAFLMSIWATLFLESWKRYSAAVTHRWGLSHFTLEAEHPRPTYLARLSHLKKTKTIMNLITGTEEPRAPFWIRWPTTLLSFSVVLILIFLALATVFGVVLYRMSLYASLSLTHKADWMNSYGIVLIPFTAACINLVCIQILNFVYARLATYMTELEYLRTQTEFDESLAIKIYLFQFVNYYTCIFYIAFVKGKFIGYPAKYTRIFNLRQEECSPGGCFMELSIQLAVIMVGQQTFNSIIEMFIPYFWKLYNVFLITTGIGNDLEQTERDDDLKRIHKNETINDIYERNDNADNQLNKLIKKTNNNKNQNKDEIELQLINDNSININENETKTQTQNEKLRNEEIKNTINNKNINITNTNDKFTLPNFNIITNQLDNIKTKTNESINKTKNIIKNPKLILNKTKSKDNIENINDKNDSVIVDIHEFNENENKKRNSKYEENVKINDEIKRNDTSRQDVSDTSGYNASNSSEHNITNNSYQSNDTKDANTSYNIIESPHSSYDIHDLQNATSNLINKANDSIKRTLKKTSSILTDEIIKKATSHLNTTPLNTNPKCKQWLEDYKLLDLGTRGLYPEYLEMVLQYGFVVLFVSAFPLAPLFALINNIFETRLDAQKFLKYYRRPVPHRATNIGIWFRILDVIAKLAVISNAILIAFTSNFIPKLMYKLFISKTYSDAGYLNFTLSYFNTSDFQASARPLYPSLNTSLCRYHNYRNPPWFTPHDLKYKRTWYYWRLLSARLGFIVIFQNIVSFVMVILQWLIPDIPGDLKNQIKKEEYLTSELIIKHETKQATQRNKLIKQKMKNKNNIKQRKTKKQTN